MLARNIVTAIVNNVEVVIDPNAARMTRQIGTHRRMSASTFAHRKRRNGARRMSMPFIVVFSVLTAIGYWRQR